MGCKSRLDLHQCGASGPVSNVRMKTPQSVRVLVVDDNPDMRSFVKLVLERAGYEAQVAADAQGALDLHRERPADVLITDIFMPESDGIELIARFKSGFPQVKIIAMSGGGHVSKKDYLPVAKTIGADGVLQKPFAAETLLRMLQDLVANRRG